MTTIPLSVLTSPLKSLGTRRLSRQIQVGPVAVGGGAPVSVQSMTTTRTSDIGA
ncbi:4-hydroxy-3-methylbut-2-en-1-yl diphosphate synthase, partial [Streptomyces sp. NPDC060085]